MSHTKPTNGRGPVKERPGDGAAVVSLARGRALSAPPRAVAQVDTLLSAPDAQAAVAALSVPELLTLVKEVGFADTTELIALATPEQLRGCLDLEVWDRDRFQDAAVRPWLAVIRQAGYEKLGAVWDTLDPELAALMLARWTRIYDLSLEEEAPEQTERPLIKTPDTFFALEITVPDEDDARMVMQIVEDLYRADMTLARHTIMAARSEPVAYLEEMSYRWRSGRVADLGYPEFYEALEVFRPLDPDRLATDAPEDSVILDPIDPFGPVADGDEARVPRALPIVMAQALGGAQFLVDALERVTDPQDAERLERSIVHLVNHVLSAARASPGDLDAVRLGAEQTAATLALALETLTGGDPDAAARTLTTVPLIRVHRAGFTMTLRLARLAQALAPCEPIVGDVDRAVLAGLLAPRPWLARELDEPPAAGVRPFATVRDVRRVARHLTALALRAAIAEHGLGVDLATLARQEEPRPQLDDFIRTALARALAGGEATAAPLGAAEIPRDFGSAARDRARALLAARLDEAGVSAGRDVFDELVRRWLDEVADILGALPERPESRFTDGVLLRDD